MDKPHRPRRLIIIGLLATLSMLSVSFPASAQGYIQFNYDSFTRGVEHRAFWEDPNLVVPWGIAFSPRGPIWVSNEGTGTSTIYNGKILGFPFPTIKKPLVVTVPPGAASPAGAKGMPTGIVFNGTSDFIVSQNGVSGPALFIFATLDGTISGWSLDVNLLNAIPVVDKSPGASYTGLALGSNSTGNFLYAANAGGLGTIDVFDKTFASATLAGSFIDPNLPSGFVPFNVQNIGGKLYVTYIPASFAPDGLVDIFDTDGNFVQHFAAHGTLNLPWGLALAPANFGQFSNDLLVGNLGDGHINAFDPKTGAFLGQLADRNGKPIVIENLWGLAFGNGGLAGRTNYLLFVAASSQGLLGSIHWLGQ